MTLATLVFKKINDWTKDYKKFEKVSEDNALKMVVMIQTNNGKDMNI